MIENKFLNAQNIKFFIIALAFLPLIGIISTLLPIAIDWHGAFRPATLELIHGRTPYTASGFYHAPWALIPLIPIALLPEPIGRAILAFVTLGSYIFVAHKMGAKPLAILFLLLSPPVFHLVLNGNVDWMTAIGFVMPPQIGLFFISVKPQMGIAIAPFWLIEAWRQGGWKKVLTTFAPFLIIFVLSLCLFGLWPIKALQQTANLPQNASLWPTSIPIGLALFVTAIRKRKIEYAIAASPCLSPYVLFHSWIGVLFSIVGSLPETIAAVIGLWVLVAFRFYS